jgi:hypothetical protein
MFEREGTEFPYAIRCAQCGSMAIGKKLLDVIQRWKELNR